LLNALGVVSERMIGHAVSWSLLSKVEIRSKVREKGEKQVAVRAKRAWICSQSYCTGDRGKGDDVGALTLLFRSIPDAYVLETPTTVLEPLS
jgi:hypothetical protein